MHLILAFILLGLVSKPLRAEVDLAYIADNLHAGGTIASYLLAVASVMCGVIFLITALTGYREHRQNPKFVPLDKPIVIALLGLVLLVLPFLGQITNKQTNSPIEIKTQKRQRNLLNTQDIDSPL